MDVGRRYTLGCFGGPLTIHRGKTERLSLRSKCPIPNEPDFVVHSTDRDQTVRSPTNLISSSLPTTQIKLFDPQRT